MGETSRKIVKEKEKTMMNIILTLLYYMILGNGPWLVTILYSIGLGYFLIPLLENPVLLEYASITIPSIPLSLILTSWLQVIVTKKILDYNTLRKIVSAKMLIKKSIIMVILINVLFFSIGFVYYYMSGVQLGIGFILLFFLTLSLSFLWVGIAPLNGLQKYGQMTLFFVLGLTIGALSAYYLALFGMSIYYVLLVQGLGYLIVAAFIYVYIIFKVFKEPILVVKLDRGLVTKILEKIGDIKDGEKLAKLIPAMIKVRESIGPDEALVIVDKAQIIAGKAEKWSKMLRENIWLMAANLFYFIFIWLDRFVVWSFIPSTIQGLFIGLNSVYEAGINIAQWGLIFSVGVASFFMADFTPRFLDALKDLYTGELEKIKQAIKVFKKNIFSRLLFTIIVTIFFIAIINLFAEPILTFFKIYNPDTLFVLRLSSIGVIFHIAVIYNYLILMYLNRLKEGTTAIGLGMIAAILTGLLIIFSVNYLYMPIAYIIGGVVGTIFSSRYISKIIDELPRDFITKAL